MKRIFFIIIVTSSSLGAQTPIQNFTLTNVVDGSPLSLESYSKTAGVAVLFTSNDCPYDRYYFDRIKNIVNTYQGKIQFLLINSYQEPGEAEEKMKNAAATWGLNVPYLSDKEQIAMSSLGARKSPEVFLLKWDGHQHSIFYSGAIDDNPSDEDAVSQFHLRNAIELTAAGKEVTVKETRSVGCTIKRNK